ncbi:cytochrome P450 [Paxillus ammoniavirescens]|nr:cytochrome P450 [Paxillus ammoniavirescens]
MSYPISSATGLALSILASVVAVDIIQRVLRSRRERNGLPLPPGPMSLPLLGNGFSVDTKEMWKTYTEWNVTYGEVLYVRLLNQEFVILNSQSDAVELLEKRSQIYSDRPSIVTAEPYGMECNLAFKRYGDHWRLFRRIFHQTFRADAALAFRTMQLRRAHQMIVNMIDDPDQHASHYSTFAGAVAMSAVYDYEPNPRDDPMVHLVDRFLQATAPAITAKRVALLTMFPFLLHIPDWLPGSSLKREARFACDCAIKMVETPYQYAKRRMEASQQPAFSMVSDHIARMQKFDEPYRSGYTTALKHASATAIIESTSSTLRSFTLAMVENPRVWKRAQAEIDAVIGMDRLPDFGDRPSLPYVDAVLREILRWQPVGPLGIPHATSTSDTYKGFYIPKGATVIANVWAMSRDEARYPNAEQFIPERFLTAEGALTDDNPSSFIFGFGRRLCPGRHTADASLWASVATMLATLEFTLAKDAEGNDITFEPKYFFRGGTRHPETFPCRIMPRSHISKEYLQRVLAG